MSQFQGDTHRRYDSPCNAKHILGWWKSLQCGTHCSDGSPGNRGHTTEMEPSGIWDRLELWDTLQYDGSPLNMGNNAMMIVLRIWYIL